MTAARVRRLLEEVTAAWVAHPVSDVVWAGDYEGAPRGAPAARLRRDEHRVVAGG